MFDDVITKPDSTIAVEQAQELYISLLNNALRCAQNIWKVENYLQMLHASDDHFDSEITRC